MQIFELTQTKKTLKEYDPSRPPPKKNYGAGVGPGVQPQYTATPKMKAAPQPAPAPQLPAPAANQVATTAPAPKLQTIAAPAQLGGPAAAKQLSTNYDPNVVDVDAKEVPNTPAGPALAAPAAAPAPISRQASQALKSYQDTAAIPPEPVQAVQPPAAQTSKLTKTEPVAPAPSTPGVKGSRLGAAIGALGNRLMAHNAASVGLSVPDTGDANPYGDQRAAAAKVSAPLISQMAREELAKWNQAVTVALQQNNVSSPAKLPTAAKQALARSLMNQVYTNFLQGKLGKEYKKLPEFVNGKAQQEAASQVAKLNNAIKAILNFNAPKSAPAAELQRWQDLSQATYDMRSLLQFFPKTIEYGAGKTMPVITAIPRGSFKIGNYSLDPSDRMDRMIGNIINDQSKDGKLPSISIGPSGIYQIGNHELNSPTGVEQKAVKIIKQQTDVLKQVSAPQQRQPKQPVASNPTTQQPSDVVQGLISLGYTPQQAAAMAAKVPPGTNTQDAIKLALAGKLNESLSWSRGFDPSRTLLKKIRQL